MPYGMERSNIMTGDYLLYGVIIAVIILVLSLFFSFVPVRLWISAAAAGEPAAGMPGETD